MKMHREFPAYCMHKKRKDETNMNFSHSKFTNKND